MTKKKRSDGFSKYLTLGIVVIAALGVIVFLVLAGRPAAPAVQQSHIDPSLPRGLTTDGLPYLGDPDAPVTMMLYEDFGCPNCRSFFQNIEPDIVETFVATGKVRLVIYTLAFINPSISLPGAEAASCARDQDMFWEYRQVLFDNQGVRPFNRQNLVDWAEELGMDRAQFSSCFDQALYRDAIIEQSQRAFEVGINATPTSEINGERHPGVIPFDRQEPPGMKQIIEAKLVEVGG